jgi:cardiolipin synthase
MFSEKWKEELFTIPNLLSLLRIALIPVYISLYLSATKESDYLLAGSVLTLSCITDVADGIIARRSHRITNVGKVLDPLADKLTQFSLIVCLSVRYPVLYPVLILFLIKELFQCGALLFFARNGKVLPGALFPGKICNTVVLSSLNLLVFFPNMPMFCVSLLTWLDLTFVLFAFGRYLWAYLGSRDYLTDL